MLSIKSIGVVTAGWLLVATVNFTTCENVRQLCAYAGLVPRQRQSGTSLNKRPNVGYAPHPRLRRALVIATMSALQHNPLIKVFYQRLQPLVVGADRRVMLHGALGGDEQGVTQAGVEEELTAITRNPTYELRRNQVQ